MHRRKGKKPIKTFLREQERFSRGCETVTCAEKNPEVKSAQTYIGFAGKGKRGGEEGLFDKL